MGIYKVVSKEWNQSHPGTFSTFKEAFAVQQKWDPLAEVQCITPEDGEVVWSRDYEDFVSEDAFWINSNVTGCLTPTLVVSNP